MKARVVELEEDLFSLKSDNSKQEAAIVQLAQLMNLHTQGALAEAIDEGYPASDLGSEGVSSDAEFEKND